METERTQMLCIGTLCGHVRLHHAMWYIILATVKDATDGKFGTNFQMILKQIKAKFSD